jgi:hypothetical protein
MRKSGILLALVATTTLTSGCYYFPYETPCPAIAQASVLSVTVAAPYAPRVGTLHVKACQDGVCTEDDLELRQGSISIDQGCRPEGVCSATASPDGTMIGMLFLDSLTESPMAVTATGTSTNGSALPVRKLDFRPRGEFTYGERCGRFVTASVVLDADGLRQAP